MNTPGSKYSVLHKKTLKISVNLYMKNDFYQTKNKPLSYFNNYQNSNIKKPSKSDSQEHPYNSLAYKRNTISKNSQYLESIVSPSRSSFLNNSKIQTNHNNLKINLNQISTEIKENFPTDNKKIGSTKNSVISNKIISKIKSNKKLKINTQSLSNEKYYENIKNIFKAALNPKKTHKTIQAINMKIKEIKNLKNDNVKNLKSMYSNKNLKNVFLFFYLGI